MGNLIMNLRQFREKYPQYDKLSDQQVSDKLYENYSDKMSRDDFNKKLGYQPVEAKQQNPLVGFMMGAGSAPIRAGINMANMIPGVNIPQLPENGQGTSYNIGKGIGDIGAFAGGGELVGAGRLAAEGIPYIGKGAQALAKGIGGIAARAAGSSAYGASQSPENRLKGAGEGAALSLVGEALPIAFKGLGKLAEFLNPKEYVQKLAGLFEKDYSRGLKEAKDLYDPITKQFGKDRLYSPHDSTIVPNETGNIPTGSYLDLDSDIINTYFGPKIKKLHNEFIKDPTFQNAHDLQSQFASETRKLGKKNPEAFTNNTIQAYETARETLNQDMQHYLDLKSPTASDQWREASSVFKNGPAVYRNNPTVFAMAEGEKQTVTAKKLVNELTKMKEAKQLPDNHYLQEALKTLEHKVTRGQGFQDIGSIAAGTALGESLSPGWGGAGAGAAIGKLLGPQLVKIAQNPFIQKKIAGMKSGSELLRNALIASYFNRNENNDNQ